MAALADNRRHQLVSACQHPPDRGRHHLQQPYLHQDSFPGFVREHGPALPQHAPAGAHSANVLRGHLPQGLLLFACWSTKSQASRPPYPGLSGLLYWKLFLKLCSSLLASLPQAGKFASIVKPQESSLKSHRLQVCHSLSGSLLWQPTRAQQQWVSVCPVTTAELSAKLWMCEYVWTASKCCLDASAARHA